MATLEKIRSKSVLLLVIIGAALIAFIIGDFFTSGRTLFGTGTTVAKVGDQKVDIHEFQQRMELANQQNQMTGRREDQAVMQQRELSNLLYEKLLQEEFGKLGLTVTDKELQEMMLGANSFALDMYVAQMYGQSGITSAQTLYDMAFNPSKYGIDQNTAAMLQQQWLQLETQVEQQLIRQKFLTLLQGTLTANELDAKAIYDDGLASSVVAYVAKDFSSLKDDDYPVSEEEIKKAWNDDKEMYKIPEEVRRISYIMVPIEPSSDDVKAGEKEVENAIVALNTQPGTEGVNDNSLFGVNRIRTTPSKITNPQLKRFADSTEVGKADIVSRLGFDFTLAKVMEKTTGTDSVTVSVLAFTEGKAKADSLVALLNGAKFESDSIRKMAGVADMQEEWSLSLLDPQTTMQIPSSWVTFFTNEQPGTYFVADTTNAEAIIIAQVVSRKAPVDVYDIAVVDYTVEPSNATINQLESELQAYINANPTADKFANNNEGKYQIFPSMVSASTPQIDNLMETKSAVNWALKAKKGEVSKIFGDDSSDRFIVVALNDIYEDYIPASNPDVHGALANKVKSEKKAEALIGQYKGKATDLAGYAQLMDSKIDTTTVNFGQQMNPYSALGTPEVVANVTLANPGQLIGPMQGNAGVVVVNVIEKDSQGRPYNYDENAAIFNRTRGVQIGNNNEVYLFNMSLFNTLIGKNKVENNLQKFFQD